MERNTSDIADVPAETPEAPTETPEPAPAEVPAAPAETPKEPTTTKETPEAAPAEVPTAPAETPKAPADASTEAPEAAMETAEPAEPAAATEQKPEKKKEPEGPKYLDLAFAMDCTGSMSSYIHQAQQNIRRIVEEIVAKEQADVRLALVQYRDHPPQDSTFVTKTNDFTNSVRKMKGWLDGCSAQGGGDGPEAVADGLHQVLKLNWRDEATKICVFISDAPPHGLSPGGDGFPNGCPDGLDPMTITNQLAEKGVMIYMVGCEPSINPYRDFFMALAEITGGQYVPLASASVLAKVIIGGAQEEISLQALRQEIDREVMAEINMLADEDCVMQEAITERVHMKVASKGFQTKQLKMNKRELPKPTARAKNLSEVNCMSDVQSKWASSSPASEPALLSSRRSRGAPPPPAAMKSASGSASGGGLMSSVMGWFGGSSKKESAAPSVAVADCGDYDDDSDDLAACMSAPSYTSAAPTSADAYEVCEDEICEAQTSRMVQQAIMTNKISRSKCKKSA